MDLILWRHAEAAEDPPEGDDLQRELTPRGEKQAARMAAWLERQIAEGTKIYSSPAVRCEQTVRLLKRKYRVRSELGPAATARGILDLVQWPAAKHPVIVVGHQPVLGETAALLLGMKGGLTIRKGAAWWFRSRERGGDQETVLLAAMSPDMA